MWLPGRPSSAQPRPISWIALTIVSWLAGVGICSTTSPCGSAETPLRLVTFNAHCLAAPGTRATRIPRYRWDEARKRHLERVASVIETLRPDILNLVEATSREAVEDLIDILHAKGLEEYQGYHVEGGDKYTGFDVSLISRLTPEIVEGESIRCMISPAGDATWRAKYSFTDETGKEHERETAVPRHALYYFKVRAIRIGLLGLHLKSDPSDDYSNARRTAESLICQRIIQKEIVARGYLPIVLGDVNDYDPDVPDFDDSRSTRTCVLANLKNYDTSSDEAELFNPAHRIERVIDRATSHWDRNENGTADSDDVFTMIDYILLPEAFRGAVERVFVSRVVDLETSDHWPVVVDLDLSKVRRD